MGSGTTAVACKNTGRHYIGFEIDPKWCKIANDRVNGIDANGHCAIISQCEDAIEIITKEEYQKIKEWLENDR